MNIHILVCALAGAHQRALACLAHAAFADSPKPTAIAERQSRSLELGQHFLPLWCVLRAWLRGM
jgi:hypothetical protein